MIRYICGCVDSVELNGDVEFLRQYLRFDSQGFVICQQHRQRRSGWRSVPYTATTMTAEGQAQWSELEYERFILFGTRPRKVQVEINISTRDSRDMRDPVLVGRETFARHNGPVSDGAEG